MTKEAKQRLQRGLGYGGFALAASLLCLYWTFPWDAVRERVETQLASSLRGSDGTTFEVAIGRLEPSWFTGVVLHQVVISAHDPRGGDAAPVSVLIPEVAGRVELLPLLRGRRSGTFEVRLGAGEARGRVEVGKGGQALTLDVTKVDLAKAHDLLAVAGKAMGSDLGGLDLAGQLDAHADLKFKGGDLTTLDGNVKADVNQTLLKGGKIGELDLPQVAIGRLDLEMQAGSGKLEVKKLAIKGDDVELTGDGVSLMLNRVLAYSSPHGKLKVHFGPGLLKRIPYLGMALNALPPPDRDGNYNLPLGGTLRSPRFM